MSDGVQRIGAVSRWHLAYDDTATRPSTYVDNAIANSSVGSQESPPAVDVSYAKGPVAGDANAGRST